MLGHFQSAKIRPLIVMSKARWRPLPDVPTMAEVGASDTYIRWPFIVEGVIIGLIGAGVTLLLLVVAYGPISQLANIVAGQVPVGFSESLIAQVAILVLAAGLLLGGVGAWISVRTYLRRA